MSRAMAETPISDHIARFWQLLRTEHVRICVDLRREVGHDSLDGPSVYWDSSTFSDDVAKELVRLAASSPDYAKGQQYKIDHDDFEGKVIGHYETLEGKRGVVLQQVGTRVVHVYREKWLKPALPVPDGREEIQSSDGGVVATTQASSSLEDKPDPLRHPVGGSINNHLSREAEVAPGPSEANATGDERPEDRAEQIIQAAIDNAPEPLKRLGAFLTGVLDEDHWPTAERMLLALAANSAGQEPDAWSYECEFGDGWARHVVFHKPQGNEWQRNIKPLYYTAPPSLDREAIARALWDDCCPGMMWGADDETHYLRMADVAILSLTTGAGQTRAVIIEECAKHVLSCDLSTLNADKKTRQQFAVAIRSLLTGDER